MITKRIDERWGLPALETLELETDACARPGRPRSPQVLATNWNQVREMAKTMSGRKMAKLLKIPRATLARELRNRGIENTAPPTTCIDPRTAGIDWVMIAEMAPTHYTVQLAEFAGVDPRTMSRHLKKRGIVAKQRKPNRNTPPTNNRARNTS